MSQVIGPAATGLPPLWWAVPNVIAGSTMPLLHPERHRKPDRELKTLNDDLPLLQRAGIRAIVCLLDLPNLPQLYSTAGFAVHLMAIPDGSAPTTGQFVAFLRFMQDQRALGNPTVVHCIAGRGRTGTVIAGYLIANGQTADAALAHVRALQPNAVETPRQLAFLQSLAVSVGARRGNKKS